MYFEIKANGHTTRYEHIPFEWVESFIQEANGWTDVQWSCGTL